MSFDCAAVPADTSLEVWKLQIAAIRRKSISERLAMAEQRQKWMREVENDFLNRRFPSASAAELAIERIRLRHGDELARAVEPLLLARGSDSHVEHGR